MNNLIYCPCGHAVARHHYEGCVGEEFLPGCTCLRPDHVAMAAAMAKAKRSARTEWTYTPLPAVSDPAKRANS